MPDALEDLRVLLREAMRDADHARQVFAAPYSSRDWEVKFHETRGVTLGIGRCVEALMKRGDRCPKFPSAGHQCVLEVDHDEICREFAKRGESPL